MPREDFTTALTKLQASNLLSGNVIQGKANLISKQVEGTREIIDNFSKRLQQIEGDPLTTEEQLDALNKDPAVNKDMVDLQDQISNFASFSINVARRQNELNKLYGGTIQALGLVGGEDAQNLSRTLTQQQRVKNAELDRQRKLPFQTLDYKNALYQSGVASLQLMTGKMKFDDLKRDRKVANLMSNMLLDNDFAKLQLGFNTNTGKTKFDLSALRDSLYLKYGNDPNFAKAWAGIDDYIRKNTRNYRPTFTNSANLTGGNLQDVLTNIQTKYRELVDATKRIGVITYDDDYQWVRDAYDNAAKDKFGQDKESLKKNQDKFEFASSMAVIDGIEDADAKALAKEVYDMRYNPTSKNYYNKHYRQLGQLLGQVYGKYTPVSPYFKVGKDNAHPYPLPDGSELDPTKIMVPLDYGQGNNRFEGQTQGLFKGTNAGGYFNPYDPKTFEDYQSSIDSLQQSMLREKGQGSVQSSNNTGGGGGF